MKQFGAPGFGKINYETPNKCSTIYISRKTHYAATGFDAKT
jgi:hypothetical protein